LSDKYESLRHYFEAFREPRPTKLGRRFAC